MRGLGFFFLLELLEQQYFMFLWDSDPLNTSEIHFVHCKGSFEFKLTFLNADCKAILLVALLFLFFFFFVFLQNAFCHELLSVESCKIEYVILVLMT